jgi:hypothetical protein
MVTSNPEPLRELTPYKSVHPPHLNGYFLSRQGQFLLQPLPNGHTLLSGTTWYELRMGPGIYWRLWSDYIVHKIHLRVLEHIRALAETLPPPAVPRVDRKFTGSPEYAKRTR